MHVPEDPDSNPSLVDSSSRKYDFLADSNYIKSKIKRLDTKKYLQKHKKLDSSDSSSSDYYSSKDSDYICKRLKKKSH